MTHLPNLLNLVPFVVDERARQTDGAVACLAVVLNRLTAVHPAVVVAWHSAGATVTRQRQQRVCFCDLRVFMRLRTLPAQLDLALDAHRRRGDVAVFEPTYPAFPAAARLRKRLRDDVVEARNEEAIREAVDAVLRYVDVATTNGAGELVTVRAVVFYVVVQAVGAERVQTGQGLGLLQTIQADLTLQELVSDVLAHLSRGGHLVSAVCSKTGGGL